MPWNQPKTSTKTPKPSSRSRSHLFLILIFLFVGSLVVFLYPSSESGDNCEVPKNISKSQHISKVSASTQTNSSPVVVDKKFTSERTLRTYIDESGIERYEGGLRVYKGDADESELRPGARKLFTNVAETQISHLFTIRPGALVLGTKKYGEKFVKDFLKCVDDPLLYDKNDTQAERELRKMVYEAKITLKEAYDRGEDIAQIMTESRLELQRIANYKRQIEKMVMESVDPEKSTKEDVLDYIAAANKLLEEKGSTPLKANVLIRKILSSSNTRRKE